MTLKQLNEMPGLKPGKREHDTLDGKHPEICKNIDNSYILNNKHIQMKPPYKIVMIDKSMYCIDDKTIVSILDAPRTNLIKPYFKSEVAHEESIDTCEEYQGKKITTEFYYAILKSGISILSDYEHYSGTKGLWKSLSKMKDVVIKIFYNHELIEEEYDLINDSLNVWSGPQYLILATTNEIINSHEPKIID